MRTPTKHSLRIRPREKKWLAVAVTFLACAPGFLGAQTAPAPVAAASPHPTDQAIVLNPFEVHTDADTSYGALNSNSITRFSTELSKMPISADIFTEDFMRDVDATSVNGMLSTYGAGMGIVAASTGAADLTQPGDRPLFGDRFSPQQLGVRGLTAGLPRRDGFTTSPTNTNTTSNFDIERVEVLRGPQGLLYGAGGGGGTIVTTSKLAQFGRNSGSVSHRIDQYGSKRTLVDANAGTGRVAARVALLREDTQQRRLFIGDLLEGYYAQLAFRLPLNTTLRVEGEYTKDNRINPSGINANFGSVANDPRSGFNLGYLLLTNQTGANNPITGAPFSKFGAIDNGQLNLRDYNSYAGWQSASLVTHYLGQVTADTVWTKWLSTTVGLNYNRSADLDTDSGISALTAPLMNGNPLNAWAVNSQMRSTLNDSKHLAARSSALVTKNFFSDRVKTQTVVGFDYEANYSGAVDFGYYLSDANGNLITTPTATDLGRKEMGVQWWSVDGGPQKHPFFAVGTPPVLKAQDGQYYARVESNPRNPAWIAGPNSGNPNLATFPDGNPQGLASRQFPNAAATSISRLNWGQYAFQRARIKADYISNYTSWWDDRFNTLLGYRRSATTTPITAGSQGTQPGRYDASYNLGLDGRITHTLRWYGSVSSTYNDAVGFNDPIGDQPPTSRAKGGEVGLKFSPFDGRVSGSLSYYETKSKDLNTNFNSIVVPVNPTGISGFLNQGSGKNNWAPVDQKSTGFELILTAAPTRNWRIRFSATQADGVINTTKSFGIRYNDQFYTDGKGNVTYKDGSPFLVPVDGTKVAGIKAAVDPATILTSSVPAQQLTTAMISNPTNDYYAWGKGNPANANGQINSGLQGTSTSDVGNVLRFFNKPGVGTAATGVSQPISGIQYAWPDPAHTGGVFVVSQAGDKTVGYPVYRVSLTNTYEFSEGPLKGFGMVVALNNGWKYRTYYYNNPDGTRPLFSQPELGWQINLNPFYKHKIFRRYVWTTQLNIANLTNHYKISLTPNNGLGFTAPNNIGIRWDGQPRSYAWTNTISF
jgi:outer membrane receptor protein involved in Fe transport